jgi:hypothetical protein
VNARKILPLFVGAIACAGLACHKKITTSSAIVRQNLQPTLGVSSGGTLKWVSESPAGPSFTIQFITPLCEGGENNLIGSPKKAAVCKVPPNSDGTYQYTITTQGKDNRAGRTSVYYAYVDGCDGCDYITKKKSKKGHGAPPPRTGSPDTVYIHCLADGKAVADPVMASAGEVVEWSQLGPETNQWQASLPDGICSNGTQFGTLEDNTPLACAIATPAPPKPSYTYKVRLKNCASDGDATLTIGTTNSQ